MSSTRTDDAGRWGSPTRPSTEVSITALDPSTSIDVLESGDFQLRVTAAQTDGVHGVRLEVDLAGAVGYWHPGGRGHRVLPADWAGATVTSLVSSAPVGALYDAAGTVILGWAAAEAVAELAITAGVSEEHKSFVVEISAVQPLPGELTFLVDRTGDSLPDTVRRLGAWVSDQLEGTPLRSPAVVQEPVYSTWYTFTQDIDADLVVAEATLAAELGCGSVFIDDGWQQLAHGRGYQGCGSWLPDEVKFPDLRATVDTIHATGLGVALWIAPLLLGADSNDYPRLGTFAPHHVPGLNCFVLDPRHPEVRSFVAETCLRLVEDYGVDLLKVDFLDQAMVYRSAEAGRGATDDSDVGQAMADLLRELRRRLAAADHAEVALEFRQPYVSPAIARFGEILRANDCPADSVANRQATVDARLLAVGQTVHADPMMWGPGGGPEAVAQQLYAGWFSVPQISMRLSDLDPAQSAALRGLLTRWREDSEVTLHGELQVGGAERGYDVVSAYRADLDRAVVVAYAPVVVDLAVRPAAGVTVINATTGPTLVLRTDRPLGAVVVRSLSGEVVSHVHPSGDVGVIELSVPAFGSATVRPADRQGSPTVD